MTIIEGVDEEGELNTEDNIFNPIRQPVAEGLGVIFFYVGLRANFFFFFR